MISRRSSGNKKAEESTIILGGLMEVKRASIVAKSKERVKCITWV